jgi:hypothetical protein
MNQDSSVTLSDATHEPQRESRSTQTLTSPQLRAFSGFVSSQKIYPTLPTDPIPTGHLSKPSSPSQKVPTSVNQSPSVLESLPKLSTLSTKSSKRIQPVSPHVNTRPRHLQAQAVPYSYALSDSSLSSPSESSVSSDSLLLDSDHLLYDTAEEDLGSTLIRSGTPSDMESLPGQSDIEDNGIKSTPSTVSTSRYMTPPTSAPLSLTSSSQGVKASKGKARQMSPSPRSSGSSKLRLPTRVSSSHSSPSILSSNMLSPLLTSPPLKSLEELCRSSSADSSLAIASSSKKQLSPSHKLLNRYVNGSDNSPPIASSLGLFQPMHASSTIYAACKDPRSPLSRKTTLPSHK